MKRKIALMLVAVLTLLCMTVGLCSCEDNSAADTDTDASAVSTEDENKDLKAKQQELLEKISELMESLNNGDGDTQDILSRIEELLKETKILQSCIAGKHELDESKVSFEWNYDFNSCLAVHTCKHCGYTEPYCTTNDVAYKNFVLTATFDTEYGIAPATLDVRDATQMDAEQVARVVAYMIGDGQGDSIEVTLKLASDADEHTFNRINEQISNLVPNNGVVELTLSGARTIPNEVFYDGFKLKSIALGDGIRNIGVSAFGCCRYVTSLTLSEGIVRIGESAFRSFDRLTSVTVPDSVTSIASTAFADCGQLESISIGKGVTKLQSNTFQNCNSLKSITFGSPLTKIDENALDGFTTSNVTLTLAYGQKNFVHNAEASTWIANDEPFNGGNEFCGLAFKAIIVSAAN